MSDSNVTFNSGTREQVALDLTKLIMRVSRSYTTEDQILELYGKCKKTVNSSSASTGRLTGT